MNQKYDYIECHTHTEFSNLSGFLDTTNKLENTIQYAFDLGLKGVALTDHEVLSGHIRAIEKEKEIKQKNPDTNFKVLLGNECYCVDRPRTVKNERGIEETIYGKFFHLILIAKNIKGHKQIRELSSLAWKESFTHKGILRRPTYKDTLEKIIGNDKGNIIVSSACLGSEFAKYILEKDKEKCIELLQWLINVFGKENVFIELQVSEDETQKIYNATAIKFAKHFDIPFIFTNDVHFLRKNDLKFHSAYLNSSNNDRETEMYSGCYFKTPQDMADMCKEYLHVEDFMKGIENTNKIYDMVEHFELEQNVKIRKRKLPEFQVKHLLKEYYNECNYISNYAYSNYEQDRFLLYSIENGLLNKKINITKNIAERLNVELEQLWDISERLDERISSYYNLSQELMDIMWDDDKGNSIVGVARGSITGMYFAYLTNIIQIDPIEFNLPHWRHIHKSRPELPDQDIDTCASKRTQIFEEIKKHYGEENCLNAITFRTETSKAAILTACRGLDINDDDAQELSQLIPTYRGRALTLHEMINGNEEEGLLPNKAFINLIAQYEGLLEMAQSIEGIVCGRGIHASAVYIYENGYLEQNSLMKAPNGKFVTAYNMDGSDYMGGLKMDFLTVEALDKIQRALELLIEYKVIEDKGSLLNNYNTYLHPDVLDYTNDKMWEKLGNNEYIDIFQMEGTVGQECMSKIKPTNLSEMAFCNSLMRLSGDDRIRPIDRYKTFKNDISLWYEEMNGYNLTKEEIAIMEKHLLEYIGVCAEQEPLMLLCMEPKIANFSVAEANKIRKGLAKKKKKLIEESKELFFKKGLENGTRKEFLNYVWDWAITPQLGYSFSKNHTLPYSAIGLQEMNLATKYPIIFWNCACLTVNAGANNEDEENSSTNYGKIATSISNMQKAGVQVDLPNINKASFGFAPMIESNSIMFGLRGINGIGDDVAKQIISNRPYTSLVDFVEKNKKTDVPDINVTNINSEDTPPWEDQPIENSEEENNNEKTLGVVAIINLIKAGCFDEIEKKPRQEIMNNYITLLASEKISYKEKLNKQSFAKIVELGLVPNEYSMIRRWYNYRTYLNTNYLSKQEPDKYVIPDTDESAMKFFNEFVRTYTYQTIKKATKKLPEQRVENSLQNGVDYYKVEDNLIILVKPFKKFYDEKMKEINEWLESKETADMFYNKQIENYSETLKEKYCKGNISKWEMDSLSYYYHDHELIDVNKTKYHLVNFFELAEEAEMIGKTVNKKTGKEYPKYEVVRIAGTILDTDNIKKTVSLLTTDGTVNVKFYTGSYIHYNKQLSIVNNKGKKTVVEKSWFKRGNKLLISGIRRGDNFFPKKDIQSGNKHTVCLIEDIFANGDLQLKLEREVVSK